MTASGLQPSRRDVLATLGAAASVLTLPQRAMASGADEPVIARGVVLEAAADSQQAGGRSIGIPGLMVSNGRDVTLTGKDGSFEISAKRSDTIFLIKPAHWNYVKRAGVPELFHTGARDAARGTDPQNLAFYLTRDPEPADFEVLLVADTQAANVEELDYVRRELQHHVQGTSARFAIHHGDVMGDDLALLGQHRDIVAATGILWHHCPGNHDMDLDSTNPGRSFDTWKKVMGPTHYAFQCAGATFILLNNVEYFGKGAKSKDGRLYRGRFGEDQLRFVENVLRHVGEDQLVVLSMHIPLLSFENPESEADTTADRQRLLDLFARHPNTVSFSGHSHTTEHHYLDRTLATGEASSHHHNVLTAFCGCWWGGPKDERGIPIADSRDGTPRGFHILEVSGNRYATRFVPMGKTAHAQMRVRLGNGQGDRTVAATAGSAAAHDSRMIVNVFDGGPHTRVSCDVACNGMTHTIKLERSKALDPHIVETFAANKSLLKPWVAAAPSSHIWSAALPASLIAGGLEGALRVSGEYGETHQIQFHSTNCT